MLLKFCFLAPLWRWLHFVFLSWLRTPRTAALRCCSVNLTESEINVLRKVNWNWLTWESVSLPGAVWNRTHVQRAGPSAWHDVWRPERVDCSWHRCLYSLMFIYLLLCALRLAPISIVLSMFTYKSLLFCLSKIFIKVLR